LSRILSDEVLQKCFIENDEYLLGNLVEKYKSMNNRFFKIVVVFYLVYFLFLT